MLLGEPGAPPTEDRVVAVLLDRDPSFDVLPGELEGLPCTQLASAEFSLLVSGGNARAVVEELTRATVAAVLGHLRAVQDETGWRIHDPQTDRLLRADPRVRDLIPDDETPDEEPPDQGRRRTSRAGLFRLLRDEGGRRIP